MAERRMFTKKVTDDDNFCNLSSSAQALYLHLSMSADDDGFCNQVTVSMFKAHASVQDLEALLEKRYIYQFENGVIVIKHWRMANALRKDRYTPTAFQEELKRLGLKKNGSYTMAKTELLPELETVERDDDFEKDDQTARQKAYKESSLPYSFDYKIRTAFYGKPCPICGNTMARTQEDGITSSNRIPTIQHNKPISKGGEHELGNISVICRQCNITIQDEETTNLNADEVAEEWEKINGCRLDAICLPQERIGKDRLDKDRIGEDSTEEEPLEAEASRSNIDYSSIIQLFNETCPSYPKVTALSDARRKAIKARLRSYTLDDFKTVFQIAESSPFLKGANDRNWSATFDWLIKDANFAKVLDGNYNHGGNAQQKPKLSKAAQDLEDAYDMIAKWAAKGDD